MSFNECIICFEECKNYVSPCNHYFCTNCITTWFYKTGKYKCPYCTQLICGFSEYRFGTKVYIYIEKDFEKHINFVNKSNRIVIKRVSKNIKAEKSGLTKDMIITHINNVPLLNTTQLIDILHHEKNTDKYVVFSVQKLEKKIKNLLSLWF